VPHFLRVAFVALLATPFAGMAMFGVNVADRLSTTIIAKTKTADMAVGPITQMQEPVTAGKADKSMVMAIPAPPGIPDKALLQAPPIPDWPDSETAAAKSAAPDIADKEPAPQEIANAPETEKDAVNNAAAFADAAAEKPDEIKPAAKTKPAIASRAKKKAAAKQRVAKTRDADKKLSAPLVLVPPQKVAQPEITDDSAKPVSEAPKNIIQNFGPSGTNQYYRRK
jgi:hypothetical protein